jgi:hypothetical protein
MYNVPVESHSNIIFAYVSEVHALVCDRAHNEKHDSDAQTPEELMKWIWNDPCDERDDSRGHE